jgi:hypothetical protein
MIFHSRKIVQSQIVTEKYARILDSEKERIYRLGTLLLLPCSILNYARGKPTVCVTRAGAGGGTPSDWENAEA